MAAPKPDPWPDLHLQADEERIATAWRKHYSDLYKTLVTISQSSRTVVTLELFSKDIISESDFDIIRELEKGRDVHDITSELLQMVRMHLRTSPTDIYKVLTILRNEKILQPIVRSIESALQAPPPPPSAPSHPLAIESIVSEVSPLSTDESTLSLSPISPVQTVAISTSTQSAVIAHPPRHDVYLSGQKGIDILRSTIDEIKIPTVISSVKTLKYRFSALVANFRRVSRQKDVYIKDLIGIIQTQLFDHQHWESPQVIQSLENINCIQSIDEYYTYLVKMGYLGYLNYGWLIPICEFLADKPLMKIMEAYESKYKKLLKESSVHELIYIFIYDPSLCPNSIIGLPVIVFELNNPWPERSMLTWDEYYRTRFPWASSTALQQVEPKCKCIRLRYAVLPRVYDDVVKDLCDEQVILELQKINVTISQMIPAAKKAKSILADSQARQRRLWQPERDVRIPVLVETYRRKFNALLDFEEQEHERILSFKCNGWYNVNIVELHKIYPEPTPYDDKKDFQLYAYLSGLNASQIMYAVQASASVVIAADTNPMSYNCKAYLLNNNYAVNEEIIYLGLNLKNAPLFHSILNDKREGRVYVWFEVKHSFFSGLKKSVSSISDVALNRIVPSASHFQKMPDLSEMPISYPKKFPLDEYQYQALLRILFSTSKAPFLILGPFGSGKTCLLAVATLLIMQQAQKLGQTARVLLCAYHQHSANTFMTEYFEKMLVDSEHPLEAKVIRVTSIRGRHHDTNKEHYTDIEKFMDYCDEDDLLQEKYLIVVSTFLTSLKFSEKLPPGFFTHILIDEGAQSLEPDCIAPLCMADEDTRITIVGDPHQVGPGLVVLGKVAHDNGLERSLLQRLYYNYLQLKESRDVESSLLLKMNHRNHRDLVDLLSKLFYNSELRLTDAVPLHSTEPYPLKFICSSLTPHDEREPTCEEEVDLILAQVEKLELNDYSSTCIMTTNQKQKTCFNRALRSRKWYHLAEVIVICSHLMQGREFSYLFLSTVEGLDGLGQPFDPLKSFSNPYIFNTAIARARSLVVAAGNPFTLIEAEKCMPEDKGCWKELIARCQMRRTFFTAPKLRDEYKRLQEKLYKLIEPHLKHEAQSSVIQEVILAETHTKQPLKFPTKPQPPKEQSPKPQMDKEKSESQLVVPVQSPKQTHPQPTTRTFGDVTPREHVISVPKESLWEHSTYVKHPQVIEEVSKPQPPKEQLLKTQMDKEKSESQLVVPVQLPKQTHPQLTTCTFGDVTPREHVISVPKESLPIQWERSAYIKYPYLKYDQNLLEDPLTVKNYRQKFHQLLCREEDGCVKLLEERCDGEYSFYILSKDFKCESRREIIRYGFVTADRLGYKIAYASDKIENKLLLAFSTGSSSYIQVHALIIGPRIFDWCSSRGLLIGFTKKEFSKLGYVHDQRSEIGTVLVSFIIKYSYFNQLYQAITAIPEAVIERMFPSSPGNFKRHKKINVAKLPHYYQEHLDLNGCQLDALSAILKCDSRKAPILVSGSFGSGKTRLLARAAYHILLDKNSRVLICAQNNSAVDAFVETFFDILKSSNPIRIILPGSRHKPTASYEKYFTTVDDSRVYKSHLIATTFFACITLYPEYNGCFTHILMDEGAQSCEPEAIIPLCMADADTKIVIAGDHKQIGPSLLVSGEIARRYGLGQSLLARLHEIYSNNELLEHSQSHTFTLLTNYRCHHALLSLPSYLFYESALLSQASDNMVHHPDTGSMVFICSSLDESVTEVIESKNEDEINLIVKEVLKYVQKLPKLESKVNICILVTTQLQKLSFKEYLHKNITHSLMEQKANIKIEIVNHIQGKEYDAVFLSTAEPTTSDAQPRNIATSPCGQYVFNTAITRAKSYVACIGNPFLLMKIEQGLMPKNEAQCWNNYIRKCIVSKSFHVPSGVSSNSKCMSLLLQKVFSTNVHKETLSAELKRDSILQSYKKAIKKNEAYSKCTVRMKDETWKVVPEHTTNQPLQHDTDDDGDEGFHEPEFYKCQLEVINRRQAIGKPINALAPPITINGYNKGLKHGVFNGDIVKVKLLEHPSDPDDADDADDNTTKIIHGKIVSLIESRHPTKYVCKADKDSPIHFLPLDKKIPILVNLPLISNKMLQHAGHKEGLEKSQKQYITVFDEESLIITDEDSIPCPRDLIPLELASQLLFVVKLIGWKSKEFRKPLGAVVEVFPHSTTFFAKKMLQVVNEVIITEDEISDSGIESGLEAEDEDIYSKHTESDVAQVIDGAIYDHAFTIDPPDSIILDDAISLIPTEGASCYKLAVLITNVAMHIDDGLDKRARSRSTSFYGAGSCVHMLPVDYSIDQLSLLPMKVRDAIAITANVNMVDGEIDVIAYDQPQLTKVMSQVKLSYRSAQSIMDGQLDSIGKFTYESVKQFDSKSRINSSMKDTLLKLFIIARHLRIKRLGEAGYAYRISDAGEEANWQAHLLVEELMIWANQQVAEYMRRHPSVSLLRRQLAPSIEEKQSLITLIEEEKLQSTLAHSFSLKSLCTSQDVSPLLMTEDTLRQLKTSDKTKLLFLLFTDRLYPKLAAISSIQMQLNKAAEYICAYGSTHEEIYSHYSMNLPHYTQFTSPIRRYGDIAVQKLVTALITGDEISDTRAMINSLCRQLNLRTELSKRYEKDMNGVKAVSKCEKTSLLYGQAFVVPRSLRSNNIFQLIFPSNEFNFLKSENTQFHLPHLCLNGGKFSVVSASLNGPNYLLQADGIGSLKEVPPVTVGSSELEEGKIKVKIFYPENIGDDEKDCKRVIGNYTADLTSKLVEVPADAWSLGQECVKTPTDENISKFINKLPPAPGKVMKTLAKLHNDRFLQSHYVAYDINKSLSMGTPVNVWVGRSLADPILTPHVSLIEIAPTVQICLDHGKNPAICFSDIQLKQASKAKYFSIGEYINLWSKVFTAEAVIDGVDKVEVIQMIRGVTLQWGELVHSENGIDDVSYVLGPDQVVSFEIHNYRKQNFGSIWIDVGFLVCARYIDKIPSSIFHFVVCASRIKPKDEKADDEDDYDDDDDYDDSDIMEVKLKAVGDHSCLVSPDIKASLEREQRLCDLQIIKMPDSYTRVFKRLHKLSKSDVTMAQYIALGKLPTDMRINRSSWLEKYNIEVLKQDRFALNLWNSNKKLNTEQCEAIELAIERKFQLIQGPPGTGKSIVGAHLAYIFAKINAPHQCVVYCAPSNKAVDVVHNKLLDLNASLDTLASFGYRKLKILRLYGRFHEKADFPDPFDAVRYQSYPSKAKGKGSYCLPQFRDDALHYKIRLRNKDIEADANKYLFEIEKYGIIPSALQKKKYFKRIKSATKFELDKNEYDIILCTCNEACSSRVNRLKHRGHIAQCIIDECGMATEPETIAAASISDHIVLIGDHKQLQPVIRYSAARECGLLTSLFERYAHGSGDVYNTGNMITLQKQYRMHPKICEFPSKQFYYGDLETDKLVSRRKLPPWSSELEHFWPGNRVPLMFCSLPYSKETMPDEKYKGVASYQSKKNEGEAKRVVSLLHILGKFHNIPYKSIAVLTPYTAQKECIEDLINGMPNKPHVASITETQGDEYDLVIFSTVRSLPHEEIYNRNYIQPDRKWFSDNLGFLTDPHLFNVGITRAKYGLIILGNRTLLEYDRKWKKLIKQYDTEYDCIVDDFDQHFEYTGISP